MEEGIHDRNILDIHRRAAAAAAGMDTLPIEEGDAAAGKDTLPDEEGDTAGTPPAVAQTDTPPAEDKPTRTLKNQTPRFRSIGNK